MEVSVVVGAIARGNLVVAGDRNLWQIVRSDIGIQRRASALGAWLEIVRI